MKVWFEGDAYDSLEFFKKTNLKNQFSFLESVFDFAEFWYSERKLWHTKTSGSTSEPKLVQISKKQIEISAKATIEYFDLSPISDGIVLCLSAVHVGGFMVLARAFVGNLDLWILPPSSKPFSDQPVHLLKKQWFVSMVPFQLSSFADDDLRSSTQYWKGILLGGAAVSEAQQEIVGLLQFPVYQSYGMTETVSHIAVRKLLAAALKQQNLSEPYRVLPGIEVKQEVNQCISIRGAVTLNRWVETKDVIELKDNRSFFIVGRLDDIINSGGIKVDPTVLKSLIKHQLTHENIDFEIIGIQDDKLGEKVVLVFVKPQNTDSIDALFWTSIFEKLKTSIDKRLLPKEIYTIQELPTTSSLKLDKQVLKKYLTLQSPIWRN